MKETIKPVYVIIGTIVGAGFASGKEIYTFFMIYGNTGIIGLIISSVIIGLVTYKVLKICAESRVQSFKNFCEVIENDTNTEKTVISKLFNTIVNIFLLIMFYVMISGFSSFLKQEFKIPTIVGSLIIVTLCYITFIGNIEKLIKLSNYLIPVLIIFIIYISTKSLNQNSFSNYSQIKYVINNDKALEIKGIIKSVLYASYNCIALIPVIIQLYLSSKEKNVNKKSIAIISTLIIIILSFSIYNLLLQGTLETLKLDMPIIAITKQIGNIYGYIYTIIIGIAIFTSAASSGIRFPK